MCTDDRGQNNQNNQATARATVFRARSKKSDIIIIIFGECWMFLPEFRTYFTMVLYVNGGRWSSTLSIFFSEEWY